MTAPAILFAYNRPIHTQRTLEALKGNILAEQTNLYVFIDGPKAGSPDPGIASVRKLIQEASGFASVTVVEREVNLGCAQSIISGVTEIFEKFNEVIVLEDDIVTSQHFLEYMNAVLSRYRDDPLVFSVTGHTFPGKHLHIPKTYPHDTYVAYRNSTWSWGTWRDRWRLIDWDMRYFPSFCANPSAREEFERGGQDLTPMLREQFEGKIDSWGIQAYYAHYRNGMRCIYPTRTLVRNIGLDYSGTHSAPNRRYYHRTLDESWVPRKFCPSGPVDERITASFRAVFDPPQPAAIQAVIHQIRGRLSSFIRPLSDKLRKVRRRVFSSGRRVDILMVNTFQKSGGAARAAYRTFLGVKGIHPEAHYLNLLSEDYRPDISGLHLGTIRGLWASRLIPRDLRPLQRYPNRQNVTFTPAVHANPFRVRLSRFRANLVHLHWVAASMMRIEELARLKVPVVWTMHDAWAFTGGCHYPGGCRGFEKECGNCPQLASGYANDLSHSLWLRKREVFSGLRLIAVAPSRWLADLARKSSLLVNHRVEVIPNGLDTDVFRPIDKAIARNYFGIPADEPVLLFAAHWLTDHRKGGDLLCQAIQKIEFPFTLLTFGEGTLPASNSVKVHSLGNLNDDISLALVYSAADVFLCPSREDNLPNTVAEAMACGTPCVAFDVNGLPDMIDHLQNGWLAKPFEVSDLVSGINWVVKHRAPSRLQNAARSKALAKYSIAQMTESYGRLYAELLGTNPRQSR